MKMLNKLVSWFKGLWSRKAEPEVVKAKRPRRKKVKTGASKREIGQLLDTLDHVYKDVRLTDMRESWVSDSTRSALRAMGPMYPLDVEMPGRVVFRDRMTWPTLIFIAFTEAFHDAQDGMVYAKFMFGVKLSKLPVGVQPVPGSVFYECGMAYPFEGKLFWMKFYVAVSERSQKVEIAKYQKSKHYKVGRDYFSRNEWTNGLEVPDESLLTMFGWGYNAFTVRQEMWRVSTRNHGFRATFCIPRKNTSAFFKDRKRTALTADGKMRPIIHHVREHQRKITDERETTVKEHIRGMREFEWNGYKCAVTAPEFHTFNADAVGIETRDSVDSSFAIQGENIGKFIADMEDGQFAPKPRLTAVAEEDREAA